MFFFCVIINQEKMWKKNVTKLEIDKHDPNTPIYLISAPTFSQPTGRSWRGMHALYAAWKLTRAMMGAGCVFCSDFSKGPYEFVMCALNKTYFFLDSLFVHWEHCMTKRRAPHEGWQPDGSARAISGTVFWRPLLFGIEHNTTFSMIRTWYQVSEKFQCQ